MEWVFLVDQMIGLVMLGVTACFAWRAHRNSRWLQEVLTPLVSHLVSLADPDYPGPPPPPPIR